VLYVVSINDPSWEKVKLSDMTGFPLYFDAYPQSTTPPAIPGAATVVYNGVSTPGPQLNSHTPGSLNPVDCFSGTTANYIVKARN
jgi:hypothetical protein